MNLKTGKTKIIHRWQRRFHLLLLLLYVSTMSGPAEAFELWSDPNTGQSIGLDISGKWTSLAAHAPEDAVLYPDRDSMTEYFRLRLGLNVTYNEQINGTLAYEQRANWVSQKSAGGASSSFLPSQARAPYRIRQFDWEISENPGSLLYRHEIDRALIAMHPEWGQAIIGRQGIGLGRGVIFSAVDIFAPFSPLEVDREWRRGVDAIRIERRISTTSSFEMIAAFGESWEQSALVGRARGYIGDIDGELIFGKRAEDTMLGGIVSAAVGDAEVHAEAAFFNTPERQADGGLFSNDREVGKFVLGSSYTFDWGNGLTLLGEYHYSGFGFKHIEDAAMQLVQKDFRDRLLRSDTQILGRQAIASQLSYPFSTSFNGSFLVLQSPQDDSGVASPSFTWDFSQTASIVGSIFVPWGHKPSGGELRSEYGATPLSLFVQLRCYF